MVNHRNRLNDSPPLTIYQSTYLQKNLSHVVLMDFYNKNQLNLMKTLIKLSMSGNVVTAWRQYIPFPVPLKVTNLHF